jgi:predicted small metal-binding protein
MAKVLHCAEVVPGCAHTMRGNTEDEVMAQAAAHAAAEHEMAEVSPELAEKIRERIKDE